jgi:predicted transcriptional regulator
VKKTFVNRGRLEIIHEILSMSREPMRKTRILYRCNLSYDQLQKYLEYLVSHELLKSFKKRQIEFFQTTERGKEFLEGYERIEIFEPKQSPYQRL